MEPLLLTWSSVLWRSMQSSNGPVYTSLHRHRQLLIERSPTLMPAMSVRGPSGGFFKLFFYYLLTRFTICYRSQLDSPILLGRGKSFEIFVRPFDFFFWGNEEEKLDIFLTWTATETFGPTGPCRSTYIVSILNFLWRCLSVAAWVWRPFPPAAVTAVDTFRFRMRSVNFETVEFS